MKEEKISRVQEHRIELLRQHFGECFNKDGSLDTHKMLELLEGLTQDSSGGGGGIRLNSQSYILQFVGKPYARALAHEPKLTYITPDSEFNTLPENRESKNLLFKGDNLEILKHLSHAYREKIKCIYIDPPYNTGEDFIYGDKRELNAEALAQIQGIDIDEAKSRLEWVNKASSTHSAWLSFMYPRLYIARQLLREDGVIFISIDDHEQAQLKILCDEIFGEGNFVGDFIRKTKSTTNDARTGVNIQHENCLCYAKNKECANLLGGEKDLSKYKNPDNDPNGAWISDNPSAKRLTENSLFSIVNPYTGKEDYPPAGRSWLFSKNTFQEHIDSGRICFKKSHKPNERGFIYKRYLKDLQTEQRTLDTLAFANNPYMNQVGTKEFKEIELVEGFSYPKPLTFMREIFKHSTTPSSDSQDPEIILDFFAGSGTSAHAIMQQNCEDSGNRRFILVQLDENIDPKKNKSAYEFVKNTLGSENPSIFDITKERILRASAKLKNEYKEQCEGIDLGFQIYHTLPKDMVSLECLKPGVSLPTLDSIPSEALLYTSMLEDGIELDSEIIPYDFGGYVGQYVKGHLYLLESGFGLAHCKRLLECIDTQEDFNPKKIIAYGLKFESARVLELDGALRSYRNKKGSELEVILRWF